MQLSKTIRNGMLKSLKGIIEAAGRDHLILSDPQTGERILLPMVYLDYVTFSEEIEYEYPFGAATWSHHISSSVLRIRKTLAP